MQKSKLLVLHEAYIARAKSKGATVRTYTVPCCGNELENIAPPKDDRWDGAVQCPHCNTLFVQFSSADKGSGAMPEMA
jgi:hypothetical protein